MKGHFAPPPPSVISVTPIPLGEARVNVLLTFYVQDKINSIINRQLVKILFIYDQVSQ